MRIVGQNYYQSYNQQPRFLNAQNQIPQIPIISSQNIKQKNSIEQLNERVQKINSIQQRIKNTIQQSTFNQSLTIEDKNISKEQILLNKYGILHKSPQIQHNRSSSAQISYSNNTSNNKSTEIVSIKQQLQKQIDQFENVDNSVQFEEIIHQIKNTLKEAEKLCINQDSLNFSQINQFMNSAQSAKINDSFNYKQNNKSIDDFLQCKQSEKKTDPISKDKQNFNEAIQSQNSDQNSVKIDDDIDQIYYKINDQNDDIFYGHNESDVLTQHNQQKDIIKSQDISNNVNNQNDLIHYQMKQNSKQSNLDKQLKAINQFIDLNSLQKDQQNQNEQQFEHKSILNYDKNLQQNVNKQLSQKLEQNFVVEQNQNLVQQQEQFKCQEQEQFKCQEQEQFKCQEQEQLNKQIKPQQQKLTQVQLMQQNQQLQTEQIKEYLVKQDKEYQTDKKQQQLIEQKQQLQCLQVYQKQENQEYKQQNQQQNMKQDFQQESIINQQQQQFLKNSKQQLQQESQLLKQLDYKQYDHISKRSQHEEHEQNCSKKITDLKNDSEQQQNSNYLFNIMCFVLILVVTYVFMMDLDELNQN